MATNYDRRKRQERDRDAFRAFLNDYVRTAVDHEIHHQDRRPPPTRRRLHSSMIDILAWIVLLILIAGVALVLAVNSGLLPESLLGKFARDTAPPATTTIVTRPITSAAPGFASDTSAAPNDAPAGDAAPIATEPPNAPDVVLGRPELVGDTPAAPAAVSDLPATPNDAESGMGGGGGRVCDASWNNCQAVGVVPLAEPHAEIAVPESDAGWGQGGGNTSDAPPPQPTPDSEHGGSYGKSGGSGRSCDASWNNCTEVTP
jgi:hypothetical protein